MRYLLTAAICLVWALTPSASRAHPLVEEGHRHAQEAAFEEALAAFDRAEEGDELTRGDFLRLLEGRALVHLALHQEREVVQQLERLVAIDPQRELSSELPPNLAERLAEVRARSPGAIRIVVTTLPIAGGVTLTTEIQNRRDSLVRAVRLCVRIDAGEWVCEDRERTTVLLRQGQTLEYYAVIVGPGGADVSRAGSPAVPLVHQDALGSGSGHAHGDPRLVEPPEEGDLPWAWIGGGAAAIVVTVVIVALVAGSDEVQIRYPRVVGGE